MKAVILAGGRGSRLAEETSLRPKPMIEIGGKPILWHIMRIYSAYDVNEFIIALGYKSDIVKEYFLNFFAFNNDISIDLVTGKTVIHNGKQPNWKIHLVDTGLDTQTGGRVKRIERWLESDETFMLTYGDGVANVDVKRLLAFHKSHGKLATMERGPLERLAMDGQLMGYRHEGFWQPMDTLRERTMLEKMWESGCAPWKVWR